MTDSPESDAKDPAHFERFERIQSMHSELLRRQRELGQHALQSDTGFYTDVQAFIRQARGAGRFLDLLREREEAQTILDYWATRLVAADVHAPDAMLADFDPDLAPELPELSCPYRGLEAFHDDRYFYGREPIVADLLSRLLANQKLIFVIGPSGSGKSSVVAGGLFSALQRFDKFDFTTLTILPGAFPFQTLSQRLQPLNLEVVHLLLFVDQFEEVFTLCNSPDERLRFVDSLSRLAEQGHSVIATLRSDFEEELAQFVVFDDAHRTSRVLLPALGIKELRNAIEKPANSVGLRFDEGIIDDIVAKILGVRSGLPLLQFALLRLWQNRVRNRVTWRTYRAVGTPLEALGRSADAFYNALLPEERETTRRIMLKLVRPKDAGTETLRLRIPIREIYVNNDAVERVEHVLTGLIGAGLVRLTGLAAATDKETLHSENVQIEVTHEALLRNWETLNDWVDQERDRLRERFLLRSRSEVWYTTAMPSAALLRGSDLRVALTYVDRSPVEQMFVAASEQAEQAELAFARKQEEDRIRGEERIRAEEQQRAAQQQIATERRQRRQVTGLLVIVSVLAVAALGATILTTVANRAAVSARQQAELRQVEAQMASRKAQSRQYAAKASSLLQTGDDPERAILLALEANKAAITSESREALYQAVLQSPLRKRFVTGHQMRIRAVDWSKDGQWIATSSDDQQIILWDGKTFVQRSILQGHLSTVFDVAFSPDSRWLASGSRDKSVRIWDVATGTELARSSYPSASVNTVAWSPDSTKLSFATAGEDGRVVVWSIDRATAQITASLSFHINGQSAESVQWSPNGKQLLTTNESGSAEIWAAETGAHLVGPFVQDAQVPSAVWAGTNWPNLFATTGADKTFVVWNSSTQISTTVRGHTGSVRNMAWNPRGPTLASVSDDNTVRIWDASTYQLLQRFEWTDANVTDLAWSPDGDFLAAVDEGHGLADNVGNNASDKAKDDSDEGALLHIWNAKTGEHITRGGHSKAINRVTWSPNGRWLLSIGEDAAMRLWDVAANSEMSSLEVSTTPTCLMWSIDGQHVVLGDQKGKTQIFDAPGALGKLGLARFTKQEHQGRVLSCAWSPTQQQFMTADASQMLIWNAQTGEVLQRIRSSENNFTDAAWSPDGKQLASVSDDAVLRLWDSKSGQLLTSKPLQAVANCVAWVDYKGQQLLAIGQRNGVVLLINLSTYVFQQMATEHAAILSLAWAKDGHTLLVTGADGIAMLWDTQDFGNPQPLANLVGHAYAVTSGAWSPDGTQLVTAGFDRIIRLWATRTDLHKFVLQEHRDEVNAVNWSPDNRNIVSASRDGRVLIWRTADGSVEAELPMTATDMLYAAWSPNGQQISFAGAALAGVWNIRTNHVLTFPVPAVAVRRAVWSPDGNALATIEAESIVRLWNVQTGEPIGQLQTTENILTQDVAWSPDGQHLATIGGDRSVRLWDARNLQQIAKPIQLHSQNARVVDWSPRDARFASGGDDAQVGAWELRATTPITLVNFPKQLTSPIYALRWSPDGTQLAVAGEDPSIRISSVTSDTTQQNEHDPIIGHTRAVRMLSWSSDGRSIASASADHTVRIDFVSDDDLLALARSRVTRVLYCAERNRYLNEAFGCAAQP